MVLPINILIKGANAICALLLQEREYLRALDVDGLRIGQPVPRYNNPATLARLLRQPNIAKGLLVIHDTLPYWRRLFHFVRFSQLIFLKQHFKL